jgi:hypothetical protein
MLTHHECGPPAGYTQPESQGAKVALFNPEVIGLNVLEHLSNQAALLGMAILLQKDIGNQHARRGQHH